MITCDVRDPGEWSFVAVERRRREVLNAWQASGVGGGGGGAGLRPQASGATSAWPRPGLGMT